jgi:hypothetical protein
MQLRKSAIRKYCGHLQLALWSVDIRNVIADIHNANSGYSQRISTTKTPSN